MLSSTAYSGLATGRIGMYFFQATNNVGGRYHLRWSTANTLPVDVGSVEQTAIDHPVYKQVLLTAI